MVSKRILFKIIHINILLFRPYEYLILLFIYFYFFVVLNGIMNILLLIDKPILVVYDKKFKFATYFLFTRTQTFSVTLPL